MCEALIVNHPDALLYQRLHKLLIMWLPLLSMRKKEVCFTRYKMPGWHLFYTRQHVATWKVSSQLNALRFIFSISKTADRRWLNHYFYTGKISLYVSALLRGKGNTVIRQAFSFFYQRDTQHLCNFRQIYSPKTKEVRINSLVTYGSRR